MLDEFGGVLRALHRSGVEMRAKALGKKPRKLEAGHACKSGQERA